MTALKTIPGPPFPNCLPCISTATGMQVHPNPMHFRPLESCLQVSAARVSAPTIQLDPPKMQGVRGDVTVIYSAAGLPLSHPAMRVEYGYDP